MSVTSSAAARFRAAMHLESPLQVVGTINAYAALLAQEAGFRAIYLSGAGVANASFGLPDLGLTTLNDVSEEVRRITGATDLPLLVDADTGWGAAFMIGRSSWSPSGRSGPGQTLWPQTGQSVGAGPGDDRSHQSSGRRPDRP